MPQLALVALGELVVDVLDVLPQLGDLILDSSPLWIESPDPEALAARLCRDEVREPLLGLLCESPDSLLLTDRLFLVRREGVLDVGRLLDEALELARALG